MNTSTQHIASCTGDDSCTPLIGVPMQPPGTYVDDAELELGPDAPMCALHELAWTLQKAND